MFTNPVVLSVFVMLLLSLARVNVILSLFLAALVGGWVSGLTTDEVMKTFVGGLGHGGGTALSYILLGALAVAVTQIGVTQILTKKITTIVRGRSIWLLLVIAGVASLSQNLIPVHIAFIPIFIPPLLWLFNELKLDRRAVASALTFGLKAPYLVLPAGFGLIFHGIVADAMKQNGLAIETGEIWPAMILPGAGMLFGLLVAIFITYKKPRVYAELPVGDVSVESESEAWQTKHTIGIIAMVLALVVQLLTDSLPLGALAAIGLMVTTKALSWDHIETTMQSGIKMMGFIAFVMLVAGGYADVIKATGGVSQLVEISSELIGGSKALGAAMMLLVGLLITMGIGTSFGTVPILAVIYVPLALELGFSPLAIAALIGTAGALGDAGSPASDSTLGPTAGLNADGQHNHIWDTCVPTFIHYNIPLLIFGWIAAMIL